MNDVIDRARAWAATDPNRADRDELEALITRAESGDRDAQGELDDRFRGPLEFGTAGLRGVVGAGETRMNEAVVLRATHGLVQYLIETVPEAKSRGLVVGRDARLRSDELARATCEVALAHGMKVYFLRDPAPTPLTAFAVAELRAAGGVVVTASHNPPEYNGYKVFLDNGAQIIPPHDQGIAARISAAPSAKAVPRVDLSAGQPFEPARVEHAYLRAVRGLREERLEQAELRIAYTPLHGVGGRFAGVAFEMAGFNDLHFVPEQSQPDGHFPTVAFPNPEEPGALSMLMDVAKARDCDIALANDPDADRLAVCVRDDSGNWRALGGNDIGVLMAHHLLTRDGRSDSNRLVVTTVVSSRLLAHMAKKMGVRYAETLTGFKWIANEGLRQEKQGSEFLFGYEEALGYTVSTVARDKDGIGAAVVFAELAASLKAKGETVLGRLRKIREEFGYFVALQKSLVLPGTEGAARIEKVMSDLRTSPPTEIAGARVASVWDLLAQTRRTADGKVEKADSLPTNDTIVLELEGGGRIAARPSGTEPKIKFYFEVKEEVGAAESSEAVEARGRARNEALLASLLGQLGLAS